MTYDDARPWAKAIRDEVLERSMPPWGAVEGIQAYRNDPSLTPMEIELIVSWVEGGAPEGNPLYLPPVPQPQISQLPVVPGATLAVSGAQSDRLKHPTTVLAVTPRNLADGDSMEVSAYKPDGGVEHLLWLRNYRSVWTRTYWFQNPLAFPAGTRIVVDAPAGAAARLSIAGR